jgi:hypothetical protein
MTAPSAPAQRTAVLDGAARASLHAPSARPMIRTVAAGAGGAGGWQALDWAAEEAVPETMRLLVVRACPAGSPLSRFPGDPPVDRLEPADPPSAHAVAAVRGAVAEGLVRAGCGAYLLIGGHGSLFARVQADRPLAIVRNADCPVAVVPFEGPEGEPR